MSFICVKMDDMEFRTVVRILTRRTLHDGFLDFTVPSHYQNNHERLRLRFQTITANSDRLTTPSISVFRTFGSDLPCGL